MALLDQGLVQVYTGTGKGKTTAALGQALRALGRGAKVCMYQFLKPTSFETGESIMATRLAPDFKLVRLEHPWSLNDSLSDQAELSRMGAAIRAILPEIIDTVGSGDWDLVVLDEIVFCLSKGIISKGELFEIIEAKGDAVELILTGRGATPELIAEADLVTEMVSVKHPYEQGVAARVGIEY